MIAACGGTLLRADVQAVASGTLPQARPGRASIAGLDAAWSAPWRDYVLSFAAWGSRQPAAWAQMSRAGGNLVVQLGFPSEHAALFGRYLRPDDRKRLQTSRHPVRQKGLPTLAWARLDLDLENRVLLIEELQCDWLRFASGLRRRLENTAAQTREARNALAYEHELLTRYGKEWSRVLLLAVLVLARDEFDCRDEFLHRPETGAHLKAITGTAPPMSLYSALPKSFGFHETEEAPALLDARHRFLKVLARRYGHLFWHLTLAG
jgi:hypothetical protein